MTSRLTYKRSSCQLHSKHRTMSTFKNSNKTQKHSAEQSDMGKVVPPNNPLQQSQGPPRPKPRPRPGQPTYCTAEEEAARLPSSDDTTYCPTHDTCKDGGMRRPKPRRAPGQPTWRDLAELHRRIRELEKTVDMLISKANTNDSSRMVRRGESPNEPVDAAQVVDAEETV